MTNAELKFGVSGRYRLDALKTDESGNIISKRELAGWFSNLITNGGMNNIGSKVGSTSSQACVVGTGNTPPAFTDTVLAAWKAGKSGVVSPTYTTNITTAPFYISSTYVFSFAAGAAAGNLSEVGITIDSTNVSSTSPLFSRALILDGSGNPTTITVLSDEILQVTYEFRVYPPNSGADVTGTFHQTIDGVDTIFNYTLRPCNLSAAKANWQFHSVVFGSTVIGPSVFPSNYSNSGGVTTGALTTDISSSPAGTPTLGYAWQSGSAAAYVANSYQSVCTLNLDLATGNDTWGTMWFGVSGLCCYQMSITPTITKTNTKIYSFTFTVSWARYTP